MGINLVVDPRGSRDGEGKIETRPGMQYVAPLWHCSFAKDKTLAQCLTLLRKNPGKVVDSLPETEFRGSDSNQEPLAQACWCGVQE